MKLRLLFVVQATLLAGPSAAFYSPQSNQRPPLSMAEQRVSPSFSTIEQKLLTNDGAAKDISSPSPTSVVLPLRGAPPSLATARDNIYKLSAAAGLLCSLFLSGDALAKLCLALFYDATNHIFIIVLLYSTMQLILSSSFALLLDFQPRTIPTGRRDVQRGRPRTTTPSGRSNQRRRTK